MKSVFKLFFLLFFRTLESHKRSLKNRRAFDKISNVSSTADRDFSHYWNFAEIEEYIEFLSKTTKLFVKKILIGTSYEGRPIHALTISLDEIVGNLPILFIDSGIHAREWAGHMSVLYLLSQLVENYSKNIDLLQGVDWVVVPVVNPDGYVYTHETVCYAVFSSGYDLMLSNFIVRTAFGAKTVSQ